MLRSLGLHFNPFLFLFYLLIFMAIICTKAWNVFWKCLTKVGHGLKPLFRRNVPLYNF